VGPELWKTRRRYQELSGDREKAGKKEEKKKGKKEARTRVPARKILTEDHTEHLTEKSRNRGTEKVTASKKEITLNKIAKGPWGQEGLARGAESIEHEGTTRPIERKNIVFPAELYEEGTSRRVSRKPKYGQRGQDNHRWVGQTFMKRGGLKKEKKEKGTLGEKR